MPVVPISSARGSKPQASAAPLRPPPDEPWALMAAAQMHAEGRLVQQASQTLPTLDLSNPKYDEIYNDQEKGEMISPMEDAVDAHIAKQKNIQKDDIIPVLRSNGETEYYKYLGPNSGGRKDWMETKPPKDVPTS